MGLLKVQIIPFSFIIQGVNFSQISTFRKLLAKNKIKKHFKKNLMITFQKI